jgi:hypothetical protein
VPITGPNDCAGNGSPYRTCLTATTGQISAWLCGTALTIRPPGHVCCERRMRGCSWRRTGQAALNGAGGEQPFDCGVGSRRRALSLSLDRTAGARLRPVGQSAPRCRGLVSILTRPPHRRHSAAFRGEATRAEVRSRNTERITTGARYRYRRRASFQGTSPGAGPGRTRPGGRSPRGGDCRTVK